MGRIIFPIVLAIAGGLLSMAAGLSNNVSFSAILIRMLATAIIFATFGLVLCWFWESGNKATSEPDFHGLIGQKIDFTLEREIPKGG